MWELPIYQELLLHGDIFDILYDACMHGGMRRKAQRLRTNALPLRTLALRCDGGHDHLPWISYVGKMKIFNTAEETAFPHLFCQRVAVELVRSW